MSENLAAIDIGTNSIHLVIARGRADGGFEVLAREKESVRLGRGAGDLDELTDDAIERGVQTLARFRQLADGHDARIAAVATSAVREARNRETFISRARDEAGVDVDVISGTEEARLIYLGALQALSFVDQRALVIDIGGGSTEFVIGEGSRIASARSLKLGAIRLTDNFFPGGVVEKGSVEEAQAYIRAYLSPAVSAMGSMPRDIAVGCSGTIATLATMALAAKSEVPLSLNLARLKAKALRKVTRTLVRTPVDERAELPGMDPKRSDIIVAGALLLRGIFEVFDIDEMVISENALREGVVFDRLQHAPKRFHHLSDPRRESVLALASAYDEDIDHITRATDLSLRLFDDLAEAHGLNDDSRDLLEAAALLHNVGLFVSHSSHHKHSYYVIRNTDRLAGFTNAEIELIALVARYHRRSPPKPKHDEFAALADRDKQRVRTLAGLLRIGIALDRTRRRVVDDLTASISSKSISLSLSIRDGADASLETYMVDERKALLEEALGRTVSVTTCEPSGGR